MNWDVLMAQKLDYVTHNGVGARFAEIRILSIVLGLLAVDFNPRFNANSVGRLHVYKRYID